MLKAIKILLNRAEGPSVACGEIEVRGENVWERADAILRMWSETAPETGGYDKCDFTITYEGRYDLKHRNIELPDLGRHVAGFVLFYGGYVRPKRMTPEQYAGFIADDREASRNFLRKYEIPGVDPAMLKEVA